MIQTDFSSVLTLMLMTAMIPVARAESGDRPTTIDAFYEQGARTRIIAHRGFSAVAPENTVISIEKAIDLGADMVEFDVTVSADGHVVVIHDETLNRTTNGQGSVSSHTLEELRRLDAGSWFATEFSGEKIPTLDEMLDTTSGRILANIEIKPEAVENDVSAKVARLVIDKGLVDQVVVSSFSPQALAQMHEIAPEIRTASLYKKKIHRGMDPLEITSEVGASAFNINHRYLNSKMRKSCRENKIPVAVYTVNDPRLMRKLIDKGVGAFFTDNPDLLMKVLAE